MKIICQHFNTDTYQIEKFVIDNVKSISSASSDKDTTIYVIVDSINYDDVDLATSKGFIIDTMNCNNDNIIAIRNVIKNDVQFSISL